MIRLLGVGILLLGLGCAATGNLPRGARVVGGGLQIDWQPPDEGTAILVERTTGKTVATLSVGPGNPFRFDVTNESDAVALEAVLGSMPTNANFVLYFVPSPKRP